MISSIAFFRCCIIFLFYFLLFSFSCHALFIFLSLIFLYCFFPSFQSVLLFCFSLAVIVLFATSFLSLPCSFCPYLSFFCLICAVSLFCYFLDIVVFSLPISLPVFCCLSAKSSTLKHILLFTIIYHFFKIILRLLFFRFVCLYLSSRLLHSFSF